MLAQLKDIEKEIHLAEYELHKKKLKYRQIELFIAHEKLKGKTDPDSKRHLIDTERKLKSIEQVLKEE